MCSRCADPRSVSSVMHTSGRVLSISPASLAPLPFRVPILDIACGPQHCVALAGGGGHDRRGPSQLLTWGDNTYGQVSVVRIAPLAPPANRWHLLCSWATTAFDGLPHHGLCQA